jgi:hypothetical protein
MEKLAGSREGIRSRIVRVCRWVLDRGDDTWTTKGGISKDSIYTLMFDFPPLSCVTGETRQTEKGAHLSEQYRTVLLAGTNCFSQVILESDSSVSPDGPWIRDVSAKHIPELGEALARISSRGLLLALPLAVPRRPFLMAAERLDILRRRAAAQGRRPLLLVPGIAALAADMVRLLLGHCGLLDQRARGERWREGRRRRGDGVGAPRRGA